MFSVSEPPTRHPTPDPDASDTGATVARERTVPLPLVLIASVAMIAVATVLAALSFFGVASILPAGLRAILVSLVALTLPGLPVAALLRLPSNGIFASVTIAVSLATNILVAQVNIAGGLKLDHFLQSILLIFCVAAVHTLARRNPEIRLLAWRPDTRAMLRAVALRRRGLILLAFAAALFASAVIRLDVHAAGTFGLIQALGLDYFLGLALLALLLAVEYRRTVIDPVMLAAANVALIAFVSMPVAWSLGTPPFPTAFAHRNIINWIAALEALPPSVDARMSWAGFFSACAHLMAVSGITDSDPFLTSASLVFGILLIFPVYAIGKAISRSSRAAWLGVTIYILFNWYQQDYFSPQAAGVQFYATIVAVLVWQLRNSPVPPIGGNVFRRAAMAWLRVPGRVKGRSVAWTKGMECVLLGIVAALVVSHQLTPLVAIPALALFAMMGLTRYKLLWVMAVLLFVAWFRFGAYGYWQGHLIEVLSDVGGVDGNLTSGVASRITGDPVYGRMQYLRVGASALLFGVAALAWFKLRRDRLAWIALCLMFLPMGLVMVQSYGGEVVIRSFLYASGVMAPMAATLLAPLLVRPVRRPAIALGATCCALLACALVLVTNRGLNTSFENVPGDVYAVARQIQEQSGDLVVGYYGQGSAFTVPLRFDPLEECYADAKTLADCTAETDISYLVDTDSDDNYLRYRYGFDGAEIDKLFDTLIDDKGFVRMYDGDGIRVLRRSEAPVMDIEAPQ